MALVDCFGFQTNNVDFARILYQVEQIAKNRVVMILGENGSGRKQLAQAIFEKKKIKNFHRYDSSNIQSLSFSNSCLVVEDIENMSFAEQNQIAQLISENRNSNWIFISQAEFENLSAKGFVHQGICSHIQAQVVVPSLFERKEDIVDIALHFLQSYAWIIGKVFKLSAEARERLANYHWPENVAELENVLEKACLKAQQGMIHAEDLEFKNRMDFQMQIGTLEEMEKKLIIQTLEFTKNNKTQAARILGISIRTLRNKLSHYRTEGVYESNV